MPSGLTLFAAKLGAKQESLLAIHERAIALRSLSLASLTTGTMAKFMIVDPGTATILSLIQSFHRRVRVCESLVWREKLGFGLGAFRSIKLRQFSGWPSNVFPNLEAGSLAAKWWFN